MSPPITLKLKLQELLFNNANSEVLLNSYESRIGEDYNCPFCHAAERSRSLLYPIPLANHQALEEDNSRCKTCRNTVVHVEVERRGHAPQIPSS